LGFVADTAVEQRCFVGQYRLFLVQKKGVVGLGTMCISQQNAKRIKFTVSDR